MLAVAGAENATAATAFAAALGYEVAGNTWFGSSSVVPAVDADPASSELAVKHCMSYPALALGVLTLGSACVSEAYTRAARDRKIVWREDEREVVLGEYAKQLLLCHRDASLYLEYGKRRTTPKRVLVGLKVEIALMMINAHVDWRKVSGATGGSLSYCQHFVSRGVLACEVSGHILLSWRARISLMLARIARELVMEVDGCESCGLAGCLHLIADHLGVDVNSGAVDASNATLRTNRLPTQNARYAALNQHLVSTMNVFAADYCPKFGSEMLSPFSIEETQEARASCSEPEIAVSPTSSLSCVHPCCGTGVVPDVGLGVGGQAEGGGHLSTLPLGIEPLCSAVCPPPTPRCVH